VTAGDSTNFTDGEHFWSSYWFFSNKPHYLPKVRDCRWLNNLTSLCKGHVRLHVCHVAGVCGCACVRVCLSEHVWKGACLCVCVFICICARVIVYTWVFDVFERLFVCLFLCFGVRVCLSLCVFTYLVYSVLVCMCLCFVCVFVQGSVCLLWREMMMIAFITIKNSLVLLIEGLCAQI